jgi:hypothetical protein
MKPDYIALGLTPDGTTLVLRPIVQSGAQVTPMFILLASLEKAGMTVACNKIGHMLILALGAYHPMVDDYNLASAAYEPDNVTCWSAGRDGEMRDGRMGLGVSDTTIQPALVFNAFAGNVPVGQDHVQSLKQLAELGKNVAPSVIAEIMLRKLAAMHPDVLSPLFPTMAL